METKELLAQLATQIAAAIIVRRAAEAATPTDYDESLVTTSMDLAKAILEEAERRSPKGGRSFFG